MAPKHIARTVGLAVAKDGSLLNDANGGIYRVAYIVIKAMQGHVLARGELVGSFGQPGNPPP